MLINFTVENWMSFRDETTFTTIASGEKQHAENLIHIEKYNLKLTPIAAIYGANASGKSNLLEAIKFSIDIVLNTRRKGDPILTKPFKLEDSKILSPSKFCFEILVDEVIYEYSFSVTRDRVEEEKLIEILPKDEQIIFERKQDKFSFLEEIDNDLNNGIAKKTKQNELFIAKAIDDNTEIERILKVDKWFRSYPGIDMRYENHRSISALLSIEPTQINQALVTISNVLGMIDVGIKKIHIDEKPFDKKWISPGQYESFIRDIKKHRFAFSKDGTIVTFNKNNDLVYREVVPYHMNKDGKLIPFQYKDESEGTKIFFSILPVVLNIILKIPDIVFIIDELDRSMHTLLSRAIIELIHKTGTSDRRSQFIFTTHDIDLMDQKLMRRDEMWLVEKDDEGASHIRSVSDFDGIRNDKKIDKMYLRGQLGGIPKIDIDKIIDSIENLKNGNIDG